MITDKDFKKFKELMKNKVGEEKYNKMTEQELFASATALITLMSAIVRSINKKSN